MDSWKGVVRSKQNQREENLNDRRKVVRDSLSMENNFLSKEEEFHKLNAELELKTQELLKEVEDVMKIHDRIPKTTNASYHSGAELQNVATVSLTNPSREKLKISSSQHEDILPESSHRMGSQGLVRFLKAKLKGLQSEMQAFQSDYKKQNEEWHKLQIEMKYIEEERRRWQQQAATFRDTTKKLEQQNSALAVKLSQQEMENCNLKKELETLKKELKIALQTSSGNEVRLNRSLEELDKLRSVLHIYKRDDKELRSLAHRKGDEAARVVNKLEKQKMELLHGFKKQMQLIDNLKKQKTHLKTTSLIHFTEAEFLKLLDWHLNN